jgi:hypothetical protein
VVNLFYGARRRPAISLGTFTRLESAALGCAFMWIAVAFVANVVLA